MQNQFPLLSALSVIFRVIGFLLLLAGGYFFLYQGVIEPQLPNHGFGLTDLFELIGGLVGVLVALGTIASGELIGVLFAIEKNTRS